MNIGIIKSEKGNKVTIAPSGEINTSTVQEFSDVLQSLDYNELDLTFDFAELKYITSAGLRVMLVTRKKLGQDNVRIIHMNETVRGIFDMCGFSEFFSINEENEESSDIPLPKDPSFKSMLAYRVKTSTDRKIFFQDEQGASWKDIDRASQVIAADLAAQGVCKGTHVGIFARNSINWISTFFAIQKLGGIVMLLNYSLKPAEIINFADIGDITHLCYDDISAKLDESALKEAIICEGSKITHVYDISASIDFCSRYNEETHAGRFLEEFNSDDPSIMIFTSGTTGRPKGVLASSHDRITNCKIFSRGIHVTPEDSICMFLPLCHVFGFGSCLSVAMLYDIPLYMPSNISDEVLIETIAKHKCTIFNSVPTKILSMVQNKTFTKEKVASVRCSLIGGAGITQQQMLLLQEKMPQTHFVPIYGMSEISPITMMPYDDTVEHITGTVGLPVKEVDVEIRDATGAICPQGVQGEICVRSDTSLLCYYKLDVDKQAFNSDGWIPTGDLGVFHPDGYLSITGRIKDLIIRGGENISPKEIEEVITELDEIADVKVVGVADDHFGEIVAAAVVMKAGGVFDRARVESHILSKLARYKAPEYYVLYETFPLLANGKVDMLNVKANVAKMRGNEAAL